MAYKSLAKLYYSDPQNYTQIYKNRFVSTESVHINFSVAKNPMFFLQNADVMSLAYHISTLDKKVTLLSMKLPGVALRQYSRKCLIDEIVLTNKIEGVHSSRKEIDDALEILSKQSQEKGKQQRFVGLVNKYLKLITKDSIALASCKDIRALYDEMFLDEVIAEDAHHAPDGKIFRKGSTSVYSGANKIIHTGVTPERKIIDAMDEALSFLHDDSVDMLFRICIFHYLFEYIHPFYDGNGRMGRFILSYYLSEILEPLLSYRISETIKEDINAYYKAFQTCNDSHNLGDLTPFLLIMLQMIEKSLKDLQISLEQKRISGDKYEKLILSFPEVQSNNSIFSLYSYLIQAALFSEKGISTGELIEQYGTSYYKVSKMILQLRPELVLCQKKGKAKYYQINLSALDDILLQKDLSGWTPST